MIEATTTPATKAAFDAAHAARGAALVDLVRAVRSLFVRAPAPVKATPVASAC